MRLKNNIGPNHFFNYASGSHPRPVQSCYGWHKNFPHHVLFHLWQFLFIEFCGILAHCFFLCLWTHFWTCLKHAHTYTALVVVKGHYYRARLLVSIFFDFPLNLCYMYTILCFIGCGHLGTYHSHNCLLRQLISFFSPFGFFALKLATNYLKQNVFRLFFLTKNYVKFPTFNTEQQEDCAYI